MVSGKPSNQSARQVDIPPTTRILVLPRTDVREYVLHGRQEYGFCSRATDVCPAQLERRRAATAAAISRRRLCSATALRAHHPPSCVVAPVGRVVPIPPHPGPRRRRERHRQRRQTPSRAGKGISVISFSVLRA
jgi:hypothetical protein